MNRLAFRSASTSRSLPIPSTSTNVVRRAGISTSLRLNAEDPFRPPNLPLVGLLADPHVQAFTQEFNKNYSPLRRGEPRSATRHDPLSNPLLYHLHVQASRNNTILSFTKPNGDILAWCSGGSMGFRNFNRSGFEAAHQSALKMFARIQKEIEDTKVNMNLEVTFKGFGKGRDAVFRALIGVEGYFVSQLVTKLTDRTPIKIGGTKSKKRRVL